MTTIAIHNGRVIDPAHGIDAVLHHGIETFTEPRLRHVVLVLPYANAFWIYFYQFSQVHCQVFVLRQFCVFF